MFEIQAPEEMPPGAYDRLLAGGWFRTAEFVARSSILCVEDTLREVAHVRLPLADHRPSKSRRRLLRRNRARFRCEIGPARVDAERRSLYQQTKPRFVGPIAQELEPLIFGRSAPIFDTRECAVYDGGTLAAVSYFDVGRSSVASMLGLHAPEYAQFGLGIYTMLEEIEAARANGARFYYPGFIVPGLTSFDYKLSLGKLQYRGTDGRWRRRVSPPGRSPRAEALLRGLAAAEQELGTSGIRSALRIYPGFGLGYLDEFGGEYLRGPAHVQVFPAKTRDDILLIEFEPVEARYALIRAEPDLTIDLLEEFDPFENPPNNEPRALRALELIRHSSSAPAVARALREQLDHGG